MAIYKTKYFLILKKKVSSESDMSLNVVHMLFNHRY